jgi:phosphoribosylformylglycinamidine cyclo-ligase
VGGETAIVPDLLASAKNYSFDLVGSVLGIIRKRSLINGKNIKPGDVIIGLESNGLHSNGYSLVRKVLLTRYNITDKPPLMRNKLGKELMRPTRIYVKPIMNIIDSLDKNVHGLAHITGGCLLQNLAD